MLHLDFETRSSLNIETVGTYRYCSSPETENLLLAWAYKDSPIKVWECLREHMPEELREMLLDFWVPLSGWHCQFERLRLEFGCGIKTAIDRWHDGMVVSRSLSLPGGLGKVGSILNIGDSQKLEEGKHLIQLFSVPLDPGGWESLWGIEKPSYRDWTSNAKDWESFKKYNIGDVEAERTISKRLNKFDLCDFDWELYQLDQIANDFGVYVDKQLLQGAEIVVQKEREYLTQQLKELTKLSNPNSVQQLLGFVKPRGYSFPSLGKAFVRRAIDGECDLQEDAKKALEYRIQLSKTGVSKLETCKDMLNPDGRIRHLFSFMGASRTHRWSGNLLQTQNLVKPSKGVSKNFERALELLKKADYETIKKEFTSPLDVASAAIRPILCAAPGHTLYVADLAAIESRGAAWLTGCEALMEVFRQGKDPYLAFAAQMSGRSYEELEAEYLAGDKTARTNAKPACLAAAYGLGPGEMTKDEEGNTIWTGLRGYANSMGIELSQELAEQSVEIFRKSYPEIPQFWWDMEKAWIYAVENEGVAEIGCLTFEMKGKVLALKFPSGSSIHYVEPRVEYEERISKKGRKYQKAVLSYSGMDQVTRQWSQGIPTRGAKLFENSIQKLCRDLFGFGMLESTKKGFNIVLHTHDEQVCEVKLDSALTVQDLIDAMCVVPDWAPGFLTNAAGFQTDYYCKD